MSGIIGDNVGRSSGLVKSAGGGAVPDWERISHQTASNDTEIDFTSFSADYIDFKIIGTNYVQATDNTDLLFRVSVGGTFQDGASDYQYAALGYDEDNNERRNYSSGAGIIRPTHLGVGSLLAAGEVASFEWILYDVHSTTYQKLSSFKACYTTYVTNMEFLTGAARFNQESNAVDGARIYAASGNIDVGEFTLYGRKIT